MSNEITNNETPVRKRPNWLAIALITIGGLLLAANLALMSIGRIADRVVRNVGDGIVVRAVDVDGNEFVIEDFDQFVEADVARIEAEADRIEAQAEAQAARIEAEAARIEQQIDRIEVARVEVPALDDIRIERAFRIAPFGPFGFFGPRFNRGPNLWGAAFLLLGLYFITRSRRNSQAAPATGPEADPPAAA